ncbi:MAG: MgtC/SapB family protein, partial [Candidatus Aureabacteria bacterium]|nr:MgtC/SapB family protein [Candidatus Auribacterota bacterium]
MSASPDLKRNPRPTPQAGREPPRSVASLVTLGVLSLIAVLASNYYLFSHLRRTFLKLDAERMRVLLGEYSPILYLNTGIAAALAAALFIAVTRLRRLSLPPPPLPPPPPAPVAAKPSEEQIRAEEERAFFFEESQTVNLAVESDFRIREANRIAANLLEVPREGLAGRDIRDFAADGARDALERYVERHLKGEFTPREEIDLKTPGGARTIRFAERHAVIKQNLLPVGVLLSGMDVTAFRRTEEEKKDLKRRLALASRMETLGLLAGGIAHDLKNIFSPLFAYPEYLLKQLPADSPLRPAIQGIKDAAWRASEIIQNFLTLARRGKADLIVGDLNQIPDPQRVRSDAFGGAAGRLHPGPGSRLAPQGFPADPAGRIRGGDGQRPGAGDAPGEDPRPFHSLPLGQGDGTIGIGAGSDGGGGGGRRSSGLHRRHLPPGRGDGVFPLFPVVSPGRGGRVEGGGCDMNETLAAIQPWEPYLRLALALIFGGLIGLERQAHGRSAGLRTNILVCLGACVLMIGFDKMFLGMNQTSAAPLIRIDPGRAAAGVITGIGFLGAGTIIKHKNVVVGLTTAATIWVVAAIGIILGLGEYDLSILVTMLVLITLYLLDRIKVRADLYKEITLEGEGGAEIYPAAAAALQPLGVVEKDY